MATQGPEDDLRDEDGNIKPCMACFAPNDEDAEFCKECGVRFGDSDVLQPLNTARAEGQMWRTLALGEKGVKRPKFVILLGVWVIFLPLLFIGAALAITQMIDRNGFVSFVFFWIGIVGIFVSLVLLYRVTKGYFKADETADGSD